MKFSESLKKYSDFKYVYQNGKSYANKYLVMYVLENGTDRNRIGISASKKVGNSVVRHRFARLVRESYRLHEGIFIDGVEAREQSITSTPPFFISSLTTPTMRGPLILLSLPIEIFNSSQALPVLSLSQSTKPLAIDATTSLVRLTS